MTKTFAIAAALAITAILTATSMAAPCGYGSSAYTPPHIPAPYLVTQVPSPYYPSYPSPYTSGGCR